MGEQWHSETVAQWNSGTEEQSYSGTMAQLHSETVAQWDSGTEEQSYSGTVAQWYSETVAQWNSGTVEQWYINRGRGPYGDFQFADRADINGPTLTKSLYLPVIKQMWRNRQMTTIAQAVLHRTRPFAIVILVQTKYY
ncbi:hypothetical protein ACROYT_G029359 [Oculina patagonica]